MFYGKTRKVPRHSKHRRLPEAQPRKLNARRTKLPELLGAERIIVDVRKIALALETSKLKPSKKTSDIGEQVTARLTDQLTTADGGSGRLEKEKAASSEKFQLDKIQLGIQKTSNKSGSSSDIFSDFVQKIMTEHAGTPNAALLSRVIDEVKKAVPPPRNHAERSRSSVMETRYAGPDVPPIHRLG